MNWHNFFFKICDTLSEKSKDPTTKVGAVIAGKENNVLSTGYNGFPIGVYDSEERLSDRTDKIQRTVHAEQNTICFAARHGVSLKDSKIYVNSLPCCNICSALLINAGIKEVHVLNKECPDRWKNSCSIGLEMFSEANVKVFLHDFNLQGFFILHYQKGILDEFPLNIDENINYFTPYNCKS